MSNCARKTLGFIFLLVLVFAWQAPAGAVVDEKPSMTSSNLVLNHPNLSRKVSLALNDTNIVDAIVYLSEKADINVAVSKTVSGRVTLSFKNVSIRDAFDIILLSNDLAAEKRGDILYILPADDYEDLHGERWAESRQVKIIKLQYAKPSDALTLLDNLKSKVGNVIVDNDSGTLVLIDTPERIYQMKETLETFDQATTTRVFELKYAVAKDVAANLAPRLDEQKLGTVKSDDRSNRIVVTTLPGKMREVEKIVRELDVKLRQVLIEAKIVEVTLSPDFDMGIDWQRLVHEGTSTGKKGTADLDVDFSLDPTPTTNFARLTVGNIITNKFTAVIELLKTVGETKILSSPRIAAMNNQEAKILVGTREAVVSSTQSLSSGTSQSTETITYIDVGIQLAVTPVINEDGFVVMKIKPEVSRVQRTITTALGTQVPIVDTTTAETNIMVKDGYTAIIGGLIKDETKRTTNKIPGVADIPILGNAFKNTHEEVEKKEMVVFLTPHVITGDTDMTDFDKKKTKPMRDYE